VATEAFTTPYPRHFGSAVMITLTTGETLSRSVSDAWGDSENPISDDALFAKARALMAAAGLAADRADALVDAALGLAAGGTLAPLRLAMAQAST
jgi:hypothetical protein